MTTDLFFELVVGPHPFWGGRPRALHLDPTEGWASTSVEVTNNPACAQVAAWLRAR